MVMSPFRKELLRKSSSITPIYGVKTPERAANMASPCTKCDSFFLHWLHLLSFGTFCLALWLPERKSDSSDVFTS